MTPTMSPEQREMMERLRREVIAAQEDEGILDKVANVLGDIGTGILEAPGQIVRGAGEAFNETVQLIDSAADWLNENVYDTTGITPEFMKVDPTIPESLLPDKATSVTGGLINDVAQWAAGMVMAGRYLKAVGIGAQATLGASAAKGAAQSAIASFQVFDPHEERLSNLIEKYPSLANPVTEYLAADPDDSELEGRFKNAIEDLGLGAVGESVFWAVRAMKYAKLGDEAKVRESMEKVESTAPKLEETQAAEAEAPKAEGQAEPEQLELGLEGGGPGPDSPRATVEENPTAEAPQFRGEPGETFKPIKKLIEVDETKLRELVQARIREQAYRGEESLAGIRTDLIENGDDIKSLMDSLRVVYRDEMIKAQGGNSEGVRSWEAVRRNTERLADIIGDDPRILIQRMQAQHQNILHLDAELRLYEDFLSTVGDQLYKLGELVADPMGPTGKYANRAELYQAFAKQYELFGNVVAMYKGLQTNVARGLNAMKMGAGPRKDLAAYLSQVSPEELMAGGARNVEKMARWIVATKGNLKATRKVVEGGFLRNLINTHNEYWINALLSGPKTHAINIASSLVNTAFMPMERVVGGAAGVVIDGAKALLTAGSLRAGTATSRNMMSEAGLAYVGMVMQLRDATKMAAKALMVGDGIIDPSNMALEVRQAISAKNYGVTDPLAAMIVNGIGNVVRIPSRLLITEDEFFKQLNYRATIQAKAMREAFDAGKHKDGTFWEYVEKRMEDAIDPATGQYRDKAAMDAAREANFTSNLNASTWLGNRTFSESLMSLAAAHPAARVVVPFIRTPANIARFVWNRTPGLNLARKQYLDDIAGKNGTEARNKAWGMMLTGSTLWATAVSFAMDGDITGYGPRDREIRKALMETGWRPYSVKIQHEDGKVEYRAFDRADPYGMFFGIAADLAEVGGHLDERTYAELAGGAVVALIRNLSSKTYLSGLINAINALSEPERRAEFWAEKQAGSYVPSFVNTFKGDDYLREVRSILDAIHARTPGLSETVDPVRNVLGEKVRVPTGWGPDWLSPFAQAFEGNDAVQAELARQMMEHESAIKPPPTKQGQVDLTQFRSPITGYTAYDRWLELTGKVEINGKTLKQSLEELIQSDLYRNRLTDGDENYDGSRIWAIRKVIGTYRKMAELEMRKEIPEADIALREEAQRAALAKLQGIQ